MVLFFSAGFYWIFQKVEINKTGIKITICKKIIREINWNSVEEILCTNVKQNPAYALKIEGEKNLNLDRRKKIKEAIRYYGDETIKEYIKKLAKEKDISKHNLDIEPLTSKANQRNFIAENCIVAQYKLTFKTIHDIHRDAFFHLIKIPVIITAFFLLSCICCFLLVGFIANKEMLIYGCATMVCLILLGLIIITCGFVFKNGISKYFKKNSVNGVIECQIDLQNDAYIITDITKDTKSVLKKCDIKKIIFLKHSIFIKQINGSISLFPKIDEICELFQ